jgi:hypothetical protein
MLGRFATRCERRLLERGAIGGQCDEVERFERTGSARKEVRTTGIWRRPAERQPVGCSPVL